MSPVLTREALAALRELDDRSRELVPVPEWKLDVWIHSLSGTDRDEFDLAMLDQKKDKRGRVTSSEVNLTNLRAKLIARSARETEDPDSALVFTPADVTWLGNKNAAALQRLYAVAMRLSGLTEEDVNEMTEELGKDQSESSGSDLPSPSGTPTLEPSKPLSLVGSSPNGEPSTDLSHSVIDG